jgi:hypothetical protein
MKLTLAGVLALQVVFCASTLAQSTRDEARPRDLQRLLEEARNLDEELQAQTDDPAAQDVRLRAEELREDAIYLKVKMRRHRRAGHEGTGISYEEVEDLRRELADLREDLERASRRAGQGPADVRLPEGTRLLLRLDEPLSSRSARREDRFDASVHRPVRVAGQLALPAGTRVRGIVRLVEPAQRPSKGGRLELDFDALYVERSRLDLYSRVVEVQDDDTGGDTAGKAGLGAVLGGVLGGILGGRKGAIVGILVGGTGAVVASKGDDVDLPAGTIVTVELTRALTLP